MDQLGHLDWMFQGCQVVLRIGTPNFNFNTCDVDGGLPGGDLFPETEAHTQKSHGDFGVFPQPCTWPPGSFHF